MGASELCSPSRKECVQFFLTGKSERFSISRLFLGKGYSLLVIPLNSKEFVGNDDLL
jgi:hypothetical protein